MLTSRMFRFVSRPQVPKLLATAIRTKYSEKLVDFSVGVRPFFPCTLAGL